MTNVVFFPRKPGTRFLPANGTEGEYFQSMWCEDCARDKVMNGEATQEQADADPSLYCKILCDSYGDDGVAEWLVGDDGQPRCIAYVKVGQPIPPALDTETPDMFGA